MCAPVPRSFLSFDRHHQNAYRKPCAVMEPLTECRWSWAFGLRYPERLHW